MSDSDSSYVLTFSEWFSELPGRNIFAQVPYDFFEDDFNTCGWDGNAKFEAGLTMILDDEPPLDSGPQSSTVKAAIFAYEAVHQRYITSKYGLEAMNAMFLQNAMAGRCRRVFCDAMPLIPIGLSSSPEKDKLKLFCARCRDIYLPSSHRHANLDGFGFGPTMAHLLVLQYQSSLLTNDVSSPRRSYEPKIHGFRIHPSSPMAPQMGWLR